jgi:phospholipid transport system substrate-binding protein
MKKLYYFLFAIIFMVAFSYRVYADVIKTSEPKIYAEKVSDEVISIVKNIKDEKEEQTKLNELFKQNVDTDFMGKFALGKYFRQLDKNQQKQYLELYRDYVMYTYVPKFRNFVNNGVKILTSTKAGDNEFLVKTKLVDKTSADAKEILLDYRVIKKGNSFMIQDIIGEGVSYITTQRSDFAGALSKVGIEEFLKKLDAKVTKLKNK